MPQKSTYFYPKIPIGLLMRDLLDEAELPKRQRPRVQSTLLVGKLSHDRALTPSLSRSADSDE